MKKTATTTRVLRVQPKISAGFTKLFDFIHYSVFTLFSCGHGRWCAFGCRDAIQHILLRHHGSEIRKLRLTLDRINAHYGLKGCSCHLGLLRLKSGDILHACDVLEVILDPHEKDLEALPRDFLHFDTAKRQYTSTKEHGQDQPCNFLSCKVGNTLMVLHGAHGWTFCVDESGTRGFVPGWVLNPPNPGDPFQSSQSLVKEIVALTSCCVDQLIFHMHDGQQQIHGSVSSGNEGYYREIEYELDPDEIIISALQIK